MDPRDHMQATVPSDDGVHDTAEEPLGLGGRTAEPADGSRGRRRPSFRTVALILVNVPALTIVGLLFLVGWISVLADGRPTGGLTAGNYEVVAGSSLALTAVLNTVMFTIVTMAVAGVIGISLAWLVEKTDFGHRRGIYTFMMVKLLVPGFVIAMGWIFMFHPRMGSINQLLRQGYDFESGPVNLRYGHRAGSRAGLSHVHHDRQQLPRPGLLVGRSGEDEWR